MVLIQFFFLQKKKKKKKYFLEVSMELIKFEKKKKKLLNKNEASYLLVRLLNEKIPQTLLFLFFF